MGSSFAESGSVSVASSSQTPSHIKFPILNERPESTYPKVYFGNSTERRSAASHNGTGKLVTTLLADQGDHVTVISDKSYLSRCQKPRDVFKNHPIKGWRPMHKSTFKFNNQDYTDYLSTSKRHFEGVRALHPHEIPYPSPSQQMTQFTYSHDGIPPTPWDSAYRQTFQDYGVEPPSKLHYPSVSNGLRMAAGSDVKKAMRISDEPTAYMTRYTTVHDKLGALLGPGVPHHKPVRRSYNPITGEDIGSGWTDDNRRISGNRVLYQGHRKEADDTFILG